ncbi:PPC domain-containing protein [Singulisphaera sp. Ch08]|uniref:PPC domain-containing protein n=1 Tax=Singulisphaera sp. Ch08 TaxID=3120278 RepID=A0AAU7C807_9BACT
MLFSVGTDETTTATMLCPRPRPSIHAYTMKSTFLALIVLMMSAAPAWAVSPTIRGINPVGGQRGTEVVVTFTGQRLADAREILFYQPGVIARNIQAAQDGSVTATFAIDREAALGLHDFRLRTATGVSPLKTFSVGVFESVAEVEPNNDFAKPQPIAMNVTVNGIADNEDIDYYAVKAKKGDRLTVEVEGIRLGLTLFDPFVAIMNSRRFELGSSDDSALIWQDGFVSVIAPEDDTYIIAARESAYAGNANCLYRLHVGNFPRPTATMPAGGEVGKEVTVRWIGDVLGETTTSLTLPERFDRNFGLVAHDARGTAPYPNAFRLSSFGNTMEAEPNDSHATATPFTPPVALNGVIGSAGDVDLYAFKAKKGQSYDVRVFARQLRSPLDSVLSIHKRGGGQVASNDDSGGPDSSVRFNAPADGEYVVSVRDHLKKGGADYAYRVELSAVAPRLTVSTPSEAPRRGTGTMAVAVPRGNRQAILINARRVDFGGALTLAASGLPAGVRFEADTMTAGNSVVPVLFSAEADAPVAGTLAKVMGKPADSSKGEIPSEFTSTAELVLGQNNVPFWTRTVDSLAVAVTEEAPFTIEIVEPKVPIVRGGTMDLKVVARRKPGFTAPIAVALPWNPPGISSKGGVVIAEKQDEALIPINAGAGAELTTWRVVVNGTYTETPTGPAPRNGERRGRGAGRLTVSSPFAKLTVAPQFLTFKFAAVSVEQGKAVDLAVKVDKAVDFAGEAKATLVGLPNKVTSEPVMITKDSTEAVFHVKTEPGSPAGETKGLICQVVVIKDGEPIVHNLGTGRLRVDAPLPQKKGAASSGGKPVAIAKAVPEKPLSRLEKLRLESKERTKAAKTNGVSGADASSVNE